MRVPDSAWQLIADSIPHMVWTAAADGGDQRWNQRAYDYTGWPPDAPLDDMLPEIVHPDDTAMVVRTWQDAARTGLRYSTECRLRRADGEFRWHRNRGLPVRDAAGTIIKWIGTASDIHEFKTSQAALRESAARLAEAERLARFGSWSVDMASGTRTWSAELYRLLGYEVDEFTPDLERFFDRLHPADAGRVRGAALAHESRPETGEDEFRIVHPGGAVRWLASRTDRVLNHTGRLVAIHGTFQDVTERRRAEEQLRFQGDLLDAVGEAVIAVDLTGSILYWSPGAEELYGWSAQEAKGRRIVDVIPTVQGSHDGADVKGPLWADEEWTGTRELRRRDGSTFVAQITRTPVLDDAGRLVALIGTSIDVSTREAARTELEQAHRTTAEALTVLATLQDEAPVGFAFVDRDLRFVRMNSEVATNLGVLIDEAVGRTVAEVMPPEMWERIAPVYLDILAGGSAVRTRRVAAPEGGMTREVIASHYPVRLGDDVIGVGVVIHDVTDRVRAEGFRSAVMSQVAEGVYTQDCDGRLMYMNSAASKMLGWTEIELRGRRMHEAVHFQDAEGSPLGAADCALLTDGTHGRLERTTGEAFTRKDGSIFPVAYSAVPLRTGSNVEGVAVVFRDISEPGSSPYVIRVLIVDGDRSTTQTFHALLDPYEGMEVAGVATTSASGVEAARRLKPDVVLVNADLPDDDGLATTMRIMAIAPLARVVLMSEKHDDAMAIDAIEAGCAGVLDKSRAWVELVSAVRAAYHGETIISQEELRRVLSKVRHGGDAGRGAHLTEREEEVLSCMRDGLTNAQVAERLDVTANTVRNHVQRILCKLNVHTKLEAVVLTSREGLHDGQA